MAKPVLHLKPSLPKIAPSKTPKVIVQSPLADAIAAKAEAHRHLNEKRDALSKTEHALVELEQFVRNAESDLEAAIAEASDELIAEGGIALLPDRAAEHAERTTKLKSEIGFRVKVRDKLKADISQAGLAFKQAQDHLDRAKRPYFQHESGEIVRKIESLEAQSSELRDRLRGMSNAHPGGLDDLAQNAQKMVMGWAPPPEEHPQTNSPRYHKMLRWAEAHQGWRKALEEDPEALPPEALIMPA